MKALQRANGVHNNKMTLQGMMLNEEKISINGKDFGHVNAIKPKQAVRESLVPGHKGMATQILNQQPICA
jgi:hypothetical protein